MLCLDLGQRRWIEAKSLDLRRRNVLGRNFYVSIPQDLGTRLTKGVGVGRIAETYISGESVVGKIGVYEIDLEHPLCKLCPAEIEAMVDLGEQLINRPETALLYEVGVAYRVARDVMNNILVLGDSLSSLAMAMVAERLGLLVYTLKKRFPGVKTHQLSIDTWDELKTRNVFIGGVLSDEERIFIEDKISRAKKTNIYYHPLMKGVKITFSPGDHVVLKRPRRLIIKSSLVSIAKKLFKLGLEKYLYVIKPGESIPENTYVIIDFRERPREKE